MADPVTDPPWDTPLLADEVNAGPAEPLPHRDRPVLPVAPARPLAVVWALAAALVRWKPSPSLPPPLQVWIQVLARSAGAGALAVGAGVALIVYPALGGPMGSDALGGLLGCGLGCVLGGVALLLTVWDGYRHLESSRGWPPASAWTGPDRLFAGLMALGPVSLLVWAILMDSRGKNPVTGVPQPLPYQATLSGVCHGGQSLALLAGLILVHRGFLTPWFDRKRREVAESDAQRRWDKRSSSTTRWERFLERPEALLLMIGWIAGGFGVLRGVGLAVTALTSTPIRSAEWWGGGAAGLGLAWVGVKWLFGAWKEFKHWMDRRGVLEEPRWNWYDSLVVAWWVQVLICFVAVTGVLPAAFSEALGTLSQVFALQVGLYPLVRMCARARACSPPDWTVSEHVYPRP
jgi:hypothetical protein